jgi:hypothetical protein
MANWYGTSRTNYFHCDRPALVEALKPFDLAIHDGTDGMVMLSPGEMSDTGDWPSFGSYEREGEEDWPEEVEFSFERHVMPHVFEGEVVIAMSAGAEKLCYVTGNAEAYVRQGAETRTAYLSLHEIYNIAAEKFQVDRTQITACEY